MTSAQPSASAAAVQVVPSADRGLTRFSSVCSWIPGILRRLNGLEHSATTSNRCRAKERNRSVRLGGVHAVLAPTLINRIVAELDE